MPTPFSTRRKHSRYRTYNLLVSLLLCLGILAGALPTASPSAVQAQEQAPALPEGELVVHSAAATSPLDVAPAEADAIVSDPRNPAWQTRYGSLAGRMSLAPRYATFAAAMAGPEVPIGDWQSHTLQEGAGNISALAALPDGRLFAGIEGGGLWVYTPAANGIYAWIAIPAGANGPASDAVTALAVFQGKLWVGTANAGISVLDPATNTWSHFNTGNGLPNNTINRLTPVKATEPLSSDYLWAGTNGGAALYSRPLLGDYGWSTVTTSNGLASNQVFDITVWRDQNTTYTFFATDNGLNRRTGNTMTQINGSGTCLFDRAKRIVVDHNNRLWLAVEQNVPAVAAASIETADAPAEADAVDAPAAGVWVPLGVCRYTAGLAGGWQKYDAATPGLPSNLITDLSVDGAGRVWMSFFPTGGNSSGGVASYDQGAWLIFRPADAPIGDGRLNRVLAVGEAVWFGRYGARVVHAYSPNWADYTAQELGNPAGKPGPLLVEAERTWVGSFAGITRYEAGEWRYRDIPNNSSLVTDIVRGVDNLLYIATEGGGLFTYDGANTFTRQTVADGLPSNDLRALLIDQDGRLWVGTGAGLALRGSNYWLVFTTANSGLASDDITSLALDGAGNIWIGTAANGISVLDPTANGADAWSTQTAANGLPADAINALANEPSGAIWAATSNGLAYWNPADGQWTSYTTSNGLPANNILSIAIDPAGIVWVGTEQGLAKLEVSQWRVFHVTGSFLHSERVTHLAADDKLVWASAGERVAVRGILDGPIGDFPPEITSISPLEGAPLDTVTITGNHFDDRGPEYNEVRFCCFNGQSGIAAPVAKVISVTVTSMVVEVPLLAKSGKITVKAHNLTVESTQEFQIVPVITGLSASCVGPGALLEIHGRGFFGVGSAAAYVTIGNGPERLADVQDPTLIRHYIRPGDTTGVVKVRLLNGKSATSSPGVTVATPFVTATAIQQGIQGEQMVWGKRTLVQLFLRTTYPDYCNVVIDKGELAWKKKGGATEIAARAIFPAAGGLQVPNAPPAIGMNTGINFVAEFNTIRSSYYTRYFPLLQFDGAKITLKRGIIEVMTIDIPASQFNYVEIGDLRHFLNVPITPKTWTPAMESAFWENARKGIEHTARVYPQPDVEGLRFGKRQWMWEYHWAPVKVDYAWLGDPDDDDDGEPDDNFGDMQDMVDDIREDLNDRRCDGGNAADDDCRPWLDQAMGIVDANLDMGGYGGKATVTCYNPFGDCDRNSAVSFNRENLLAPIYLQEAIHATSWVDTNAANHDGDNKHHSRYDEGEWRDAINCMTILNFRRALMDQTGSLKRVIRLDANDPFQFPMPVSAPSACETDMTPKSAMSYAPRQRDRNTFLEPVDYRHTLNYIRNHGLQAAQAALLNVDQTLRINGKIDQTNKVTVTMSSILGTEGAVLSIPGGDYHLLMLAESGQVLHDHAFTLAMEHTHTDANDQVRSRFNLRVPFPAGVKTVAIQHDGMVLWAEQVSSNAPTASFVAPNSGSFNAANAIPVSWQAADADGDALQFALDYTPDNGDSWFLIANKLTGNSYEWTPGFVPASSQGRLRLRVSDGFNTAEALSAPFELTAQAPYAFIYMPAGGAVVTEGSLVDFEGGSLTGDGFDTGSFEWSKNGVLLSSQRGMSLTLEETGTHIFDLKVTANGLSATKSVSVTVVADYDRDGLPNDWELSHGFNPIDPADALNDPDNDGLTNLEEYKLGTNPLVADTDGDGMNDGDEVNASRDPLVADTSPTGPVLQVGATHVGFTVYTAGFTPAPQGFWVTNGGPGDLNWSATADVPWLQLSVASGAAPTEVIISASSAGMEPGDYTGHITFTAPGAAGSPQVVTATFKVRSESSTPLQQLFLPLVGNQ